MSSTNSRAFWAVLILYTFIPFLYYYIVGIDFDVEHSQLLDVKFFIFIVHFTGVDDCIRTVEFVYVLQSEYLCS